MSSNNIIDLIIKILVFIFGPIIQLILRIIAFLISLLALNAPLRNFNVYIGSLATIVYLWIKSRLGRRADKINSTSDLLNPLFWIFIIWALLNSLFIHLRKHLHIILRILFSPFGLLLLIIAFILSFIRRPCAVEEVEEVEEVNDAPIPPAPVQDPDTEPSNESPKSPAPEVKSNKTTKSDSSKDSESSKKVVKKSTDWLNDTDSSNGGGCNCHKKNKHSRKGDCDDSDCNH